MSMLLLMEKIRVLGSVPRLAFHTARSQMNEGIGISSNQPQRRNSKLSVAASFELLLSTWQEDLQPKP
ncbi:uncharacterized [Tachysurus ichikawai]